MKAFQFLDIEFQKKAIEISKFKSDTYDVAVGGEAQAQRMLLEGLRIFYKWIMVPKVIGKFIAVNLGLIPEPVSPLIPKEAPKPKETKLHEVPQQGSVANESTPVTTP